MIDIEDVYEYRYKNDYLGIEVTSTNEYKYNKKVYSTSIKTKDVSVSLPLKPELIIDILKLQIKGGDSFNKISVTHYQDYLVNEEIVFIFGGYGIKTIEYKGFAHNFGHNSLSQFKLLEILEKFIPI